MISRKIIHILSSVFVFGGFIFILNCDLATVLAEFLIVFFPVFHDLPSSVFVLLYLLILCSVHRTQSKLVTS